MEMRRKDLGVTDRSAIEAIIARALVCRLGLVDGDRPYVVPMSFGYEDGSFYFHAAREGRKIDVLRANANACVEIDLDHEVVPRENACTWSMNYRSVIAFGRARLLDDPEEKRRALAVIMAHYAGREFDYPDGVVAGVAVIRVDVETMTGKSRYAASSA